jgi:type I restriction-modification system DNA methylase subunit
MDYKKLSDDELIELCKEKSIDYSNSKTKKNYARTTLISRLNKSDKDIITTDKEIEIIQDEIVNIEYKNEVIWTLSDEDKKNNDEYKEIENKLRSCIRCCHNYLYSNGSIVGNEASNDIILLFILKVLNYLYISNKDIIINKIQSLTSNKNYNKYLEILDNINNLKKITDGDDINSQYEDYMDDVVRGKLLPLIFTEDKDFILNTKSEENNIIKIITEFDKIILNDITIKAFSTISIYEYFNSGYEGKSKNKKLGQFFTPKKVINSILYGCQFKNMVDEFENPSIYDPCCGTAGLLCVLYNSCSNINIDNIYGCEISKDTIKFAIASLILSTNSLFENLNKGCALSNNKYIFDNKKFDVIFTNPPFGTSLKYKELKSKFDKNKPYNFNIKFEDIYPFECNNGVNLFIMNIIHSLNDNGICAVIVPDGELITSKALFYMRKYIIDNCKMLKIIAVESKAFEYTQIKTNVLIFKKQKGIDNHKNIEFMKINKNCNEVKLIAIADLDKYYTFELETENNDIINYELNKDIEIIKFGKMFDLIKGTIQSSKVVEDINGITLVTGAKEFKTIKLLSDNTIIAGSNLFICTNGNGDKIPIKFYDKDCYYSCLMSLCKLKEEFNDKINIKYIYYYLLEKQTYIEDKYQKGLANKSLDVEKFNEMDILIPTIEKQEEIVKYLDGLDNKNILFEYSNNKLFELLLNKLDINDRIELFNNIENSNIDINNQINKLFELNNYKLKIVKYNLTTKFIEFGQMFDLIKGTIQSSKVVEDINGDIMFVSKAEITEETRKIKYDYYNTNALYIAQAFNGNGKCPIRFYKNNSIHSNLLYHIKIKDYYKNKINIKYIYYYLLEKQTYIEDKYQKGLAQKSLNVEKFKLMKIPIPIIEKQEEIIEYCDNNLEIINNLKKTIQNNKIMMKELF